MRLVLLKVDDNGKRELEEGRRCWSGRLLVDDGVVSVDEDVQASRRVTVRNEGWEGVWEVRERAVEFEESEEQETERQRG